MAPDLGGWIHNFTVTDTQTHKGGYTLYKITSIVSESDKNYNFNWYLI